MSFFTASFSDLVFTTTCTFLVLERDQLQKDREDEKMEDPLTVNVKFSIYHK